jgi:hypothetical protein
MARPPKDEVRSDIRFRRIELKLEHPLIGDTEINATLAKEFNLSLQSIWYYLRLSKEADARVHYTPEERYKLCAMTRRQLLIYAAETGKNFNTLYAMVHRHKKNGIDNQSKTEARVELCEERNFIDFSRLVDLKAFKLPGGAFKEARKQVQSVNGLDLIPPNFLVHNGAMKFYALNLQEQLALLAAPKRFLRDNAGRITHQWKSFDPRGHYFVLLDTAIADRHYEGTAISTHETFAAAAAAKKAADRVPEPPQTLIVRKFGESRALCCRIQPGEWVQKHSPDAAGFDISMGEGGGTILHPKDFTYPETPKAAPAPDDMDLDDLLEPAPTPITVGEDAEPDYEEIYED